MLDATEFCISGHDNTTMLCMLLASTQCTTKNTLRNVVRNAFQGLIPTTKYRHHHSPLHIWFRWQNRATHKALDATGPAWSSRTHPFLCVLSLRSGRTDLPFLEKLHVTFSENADSSKAKPLQTLLTGSAFSNKPVSNFKRNITQINVQGFLHNTHKILTNISGRHTTVSQK